MARKNIPISELHRILSYNPRTGTFISRVSRARNVCKVGQRLGSWDKNWKYMIMSIHGQKYMLSHLAIAMIERVWPGDQGYDVTYIDGDRRNLKYNNLKKVPKRSKYGKIQKMNPRNTSGFTGVWYDKRAKKWVATGGRGKGRFLGHFDAKQDAIIRRRIWEQRNTIKDR